MALSLTEVPTTILHSLWRAASDVLPMPVNQGDAIRLSGSVTQTDIGVLIGLTGSAAGRLILLGRTELFAKIADEMFGMELHGDMLTSFCGELCNMLGGNMCIRAADEGIALDISPPTVMVGEARLTGFASAIQLPLDIQRIGTLDAILALSTGE